ncbi:glycosyltransferase [Planctomicrobium sp. SH527]|uniref:glycosyltransferase n=1 Tax=Planctomicrobium sp. SH527 TaxID=3448123 RepID=UPI003F5C615B
MREIHRSSVAIIIPCHNYARFLGEAIESALAQTWLPAEILVILDGCTDESAAVAGQYLGYGVRSVEIFSRDVYLARRAGLIRTQSEFVTFLDADDILAPDYIELLLPHFRDPAVGAVTPGVDHFGNIGGQWSPNPEIQDITLGNCMCSASMVRREALLSSGCFENLANVGIHGQDYQTWLEIHRAGWKLKKGEARVRYRRHNANRTLTSPSPGFDLFREAARTELRPQPRTRALFLTQTCNSGGVLENFLSLLQYAERIEWKAALIVEGGGSDDPMVDAVEQFIPVYGTTSLSPVSNCHRIRRFHSSLEAIELLADEFDVIYCWGQGCGDILRQLTKQGRTWPVVLGLHGTGAWTKTCAAAAPLATRTITVCDDAKHLVPPEYRHHVRVIHNGVNFPRMAVRRSREEMRRHWKIDNEQVRTVGFVGRWSAEKNPLALAHAIESLGANYHAVYCSPQFMPQGGAAPARELDVVKRLTQGRVSFDFTTDVGDVYQALDCLMIPSLHEGGPLVALEAMGAGCPVVSTPVGMLPELARQFEERGIPQGILFVPLDASPELWAERIEAVFTSQQQVVFPAVRTAILELKSARRMVDAWEEVLIEACHQKRAGSFQPKESLHAPAANGATPSRVTAFTGGHL